MSKWKLRNIYKRWIAGLLSNASRHMVNKWNVVDCEVFKQFHDFIDDTSVYNVEIIDLEDSDQIYKWVGAQFYNGTVFTIPNDETRILCYNIQGSKYIDNVKEGLFKWTGGCIWDDAIYCFPRAANSFLKICNGMAEEIPLSIEYEKEHHYSGVCTKAGIVYQPPRNTNHILKTNLVNGLSTKIDIVDKKYRLNFSYCGSIIHPNGFVYFFPENGRVIKLNTLTDEWCFIGKRISTMCFDAKVGLDGNIYGYSAYREGIMKIDVSSDLIKMVHQEINPGAYGTKYGVDGCLYAIPGDGSIIYRFDVLRDKVTSLCELNSIQEAKYAGGVTDLNGRIVGIPATENSILLLSPDKRLRIPDALYDIFYKDNY